MSDQLPFREILARARKDTASGLWGWIGGKAGASITIGGGMVGLGLGQAFGLDAALSGIFGTLIAIVALWAVNLHRAEVRIWQDRALSAEDRVRALGAEGRSTERARADWTIRDLFFHLRADVLQDDSGVQIWKEVALQIKQAHAEGDLTIWATPMPADFLEEMHFPADRKPPVKLRNDYWQDGDFTYAFFVEGEETRWKEHCQTSSHNRKDESYCDLMVSKAQALMLWPQDAAKDEATGGVAVWRMSQTLADEFDWKVKQAADAIESAASLGAIRVIGRKMGPGTPPLRVLPAEYWIEHTMHLHPPKGDSLGQTFAKSNRFNASDTYDLRVFESEVRKAIKRDSGLERDRG